MVRNKLYAIDFIVGEFNFIELYSIFLVKKEFLIYENY